MTESVKHTPGPWETEENSYGNEIDVYPVKDGPPPIGRWAEICTVKDYENDEEMRANARLIAAAPDLLEAAHNALAGGVPKEIAVALRLAISKAEGRS